jgi:neuronal cell adhesion protein
VDVEGNLWFSNVTRNDMSDEFLYACSAASYFRNEYKLGNRVFLQVHDHYVHTSPGPYFYEL